MIEIEQRGGLADLLEHARVTATARRIEFDQITGRKILADHRVLGRLADDDAHVLQRDHPL